MSIFRKASLFLLLLVCCSIMTVCALAENYTWFPDDKPIVLYQGNGVVIKFGGLSDTHTTGMDFNFRIDISNDSSETVTLDLERVLFNDCYLPMINASGIDVDEDSRVLMSTLNKWLISSEDILEGYHFDHVAKIELVFTLKSGKKVIFEDKSYIISTDLSICDVMKDNSSFTRRHSNGFTGGILDTDKLQTIYDDNYISLFWIGLEDTHTTGMHFHPAILIVNNSEQNLVVDLGRIKVNGYMMSVGNSGRVNIPAKAKYLTSIFYKWLISSSDLIDEYQSDTIDNFRFNLTVKTNNQQTIVDGKKISIDTDIDIYELMGGNSSFTKRYPTK